MDSARIRRVKRLHLLGLAMFLYGAVMLGLLFSPWKVWAANHSVAAFVSATDKRVGNSIDTPVDMPLSIVGDAVMMFAGLWTGILVPRMLTRFRSGYTVGEPGSVREEPSR
jgi:hypothetical protein